MSETVATCGEMALTNQTLAYYYYQQLYSLQNTYGNMLPYMLDTSKGFDEQLSMDGDQTWQTFLVTSAISQFQQIAALYQTAQAEGIALSQEELDYLNANTDFDALAAGYGLADGKTLMEPFPDGRKPKHIQIEIPGPVECLPGSALHGDMMDSCNHDPSAPFMIDYIASPPPGQIPF